MRKYWEDHRNERVDHRRDHHGPALLRGCAELSQRRGVRAYILLRDNHEDDRALWDVDVINRWGGQPATPKQRAVIARRCRDWTPPEDLTKGQASAVLNRLFAKEA